MKHSAELANTRLRVALRLHNAPAVMRALFTAAIAAIGLAAPAIAIADAQLSPMMDPNQPVQCAKDKSGLEWRMQCDASTKVCLYAPNVELDADANRLDKPLERARDCAVDLPFD